MRCPFWLKAALLLIGWFACWMLSKPQAGLAQIIVAGVIVQLANSLYFMATDKN